MCSSLYFQARRWRLYTLYYTPIYYLLDYKRDMAPVWEAAMCDGK
jgi:hypothetical protein